MPPLFIAIHALLGAGCLFLALRFPAKHLFALSLASLALVIAGLAVERNTDWAWSAMLLGWPDAVFFTNLSFEGVLVLVAVMWRTAANKPARARAATLGLLALGGATWSYRWYFVPVPPHLRGRIDPSGYCAQTSHSSCSAAAATMLLHHEGIETTEAEMARLCLTRDGGGTPPLGLFRGLALRTRGTDLQPRLQILNPRSQLSALHCPAILSVGLSYFAPNRIVDEMRDYGWERGQQHAIVVTAVDPAGRWLEVSDPSYGRERWPAAHVEELWSGRALSLIRVR